MLEESTTATDLVFESSFFMAEDMLRTAGESVKEIISNGRMLYGISVALDRVKTNLRKHVLSHKWTSAADRKKLRKRIAQIESLSKNCKAFAKIHEKAVDSISNNMMKMEGDDDLLEILTQLDLDNFWEEGEDQ